MGYGGVTVTILFLLYTMIFNTTVHGRIRVKAWDERYGQDTYTIFDIGSSRGSDTKAVEMIKEINQMRGNVRFERQQQGRVRQ